MKKIAKFALGALMLAGTTAMLAEPAAAHVSVGIGIGIPGPGYYPYPRRACDPYYCDAYYDGSVFIGGAWYNGHYPWRYWGGHRQFWFHNGWHDGSRFRFAGFHDHGFRGGFHPGGFHGGFGGRAHGHR